MTDTEMQGRRVDLPDDNYLSFEPGDYGKDSDGDWFCRVPAPGFMIGGLKAHQVTEHEDGTITVSPSILCYTEDHVWHGYLERGVWREI